MHKSYLIISLLLVSIISCTEKKKVEDNAALRLKGDSLITQTFDTLRNTLVRAIGEKGFPGAVSFCNTEALPLTNSYVYEGIIIKRSSDKIRNSANAPDSIEQEILSVYLQMKKDKQELKSVLKKDAAGNYHYFKPILLQTMCLNCHGDKTTQIKPDTWEVILQKYPKDAAFNYKDGDLRGIWHLTFLKKKSMNQTEKRINKDLILREKLAIERTDMAIERTLLSFIRTSLYFVIAGMTVNSLLKVSYGWWVEILFWFLGIVVLILGLLKYRQQKKKLKNNEKHIGDYKLEWEEDIE